MVSNDSSSGTRSSVDDAEEFDAGVGDGSGVVGELD